MSNLSETMEGLQPRWYSSAWILACCLYTNTSIGCLGSEALAENGSTYLQMDTYSSCPPPSQCPHLIISVPSSVFPLPGTLVTSQWAYCLPFRKLIP